MPDTLRKHGLDSSLDELLDSLPEMDAWKRQLCLTLDVAQDQKFLKIIEGGRVKTYSVLLKGTDGDAQSDAARKILNVPVTDFLDAVHQAWRSQIAFAWDIGEQSLATDPFFDAKPESCEAARDDQSGIIDEVSDEWTSDRLADELLRLDVKKDWPRLRELILAAEDLGFTPKQSVKLAPRLLDLAIQYRASNDAQDTPVVYSAIRTGASMLRPKEAERLLPLLQPGHPIETSVVTLKMVGRIFEAQPPEKQDQHPTLARKVREIAASLLNPYAIASSQSAATAQLAVHALAAMASNETLDVVRTVRRIGVSWFTQQTARELRELRIFWNERSTPVAPKVLELLGHATQELQTT